MGICETNPKNNIEHPVFGMGTLQLVGSEVLMKFSLHHPHTTLLEQIEEADNIRSSGLFLIPVDINRSDNFGCEGLTVDVNSFFS